MPTTPSAATAVAATSTATSLAAVVLYFASKNGYGDMPPFVAVSIVGLIISAAHVVLRLRVIQGLFASAPVAPAEPPTPVTLAAPAAPTA